jgi:hypothetical protein
MSDEVDEGQMNRRPDAFHLRASVLIVPLLLESLLLRSYSLGAARRALRCSCRARPERGVPRDAEPLHPTRMHGSANVQRPKKDEVGRGAGLRGAWCLPGKARWCTLVHQRASASTGPGFHRILSVLSLFRNRQQVLTAPSLIDN